MDIKEYLTDSSKINAIIASDKILKNKKLLNDFFSMSFSEEEKYSVRASYVLCHLSKINPSLIEKYSEEIIEKLYILKNSGIKKNLLKIFESYIFLKDEDLLGKLIEICYIFLRNPAESLATRIYSMQIIYNTAMKIPELKYELKLILEEILTEDQPSLIQRAKRLIKKL